MKAVSLISVGIDSPVATYLMMKKGVEVTGVNFSNQPMDTVEALLGIKKKIGLRKVLVMDMSAFHNMISKHERSRCVLCKRFMYKAAEKIAMQEGAQALITGENLGQVASQTLRNMEAIDESVSIPVLRPLLCYDKNETIAIAREIETFDISIKNNGRCPWVPDSPSTNSVIHKLMEKEDALGLSRLIDDAIAGAKVF